MDIYIELVLNPTEENQGERKYNHILIIWLSTVYLLFIALIRLSLSVYLH